MILCVSLQDEDGIDAALLEGWNIFDNILILTYCKLCNDDKAFYAGAGEDGIHATLLEGWNIVEIFMMRKFLQLKR